MYVYVKTNISVITMDAYMVNASKESQIIRVIAKELDMKEYAVKTVIISTIVHLFSWFCGEFKIHL